MNTVICGLGQTVALEGDARVHVSGGDAGSALAVRLLRGEGAVEESAGPIAAGGCSYLPDGPIVLRTVGRVELWIERVRGWPLRRPLRATPQAVVGRAAAPDPRRAIGRAARDVAGYLQAVHRLPRAAALARLGLLGDARLLGAGQPGDPFVAEVRLSVAALGSLSAGQTAPSPV